jgi:predicted Zn-dependent peptidase
MSKEYKIKTLGNGMKILTVRMPTSITSTVMMLVNTGSDYELPGQEGISHFLEHMCFKGTKKRPNALQISLELDSLGAHSNAFTDHEMTGYFTKGDSKHFKKFVDIVSDIYLNSTFPAVEIEKEKGVVIEEINMYEDSPSSVIDEKMNTFMYSESRVGLPVIGTKESVKSFKQEDLVHYRNSRYAPSNTIFIVAGPHSYKESFDVVSKYFLNYENKNFKNHKIPKVNIKPKQNVFFKKEKKTDQVHAVIGFPSFNVTDVRSPKAKMLAAVLGAGMSSRLFNLLREELGACYYVYAKQSLRTHSGRLLIYSGITKEKVPIVISSILKECKKLKNELVDDKELKKVKNYLIGSLKMSMESSDDVAYFYGNQILLQGKIKTLNEKIKDIQKVNSKDIKSIANQVFKNENLHIGLIGDMDFIKLFNSSISDIL